MKIHDELGERLQKANDCIKLTRSLVQKLHEEQVSDEEILQRSRERVYDSLRTLQTKTRLRHPHLS